MPPRVPGSTYRLQLSKQLTFRDATALVDYLEALGITDVYASPILAARTGSDHGYDVIDHARLNPDLGTEGDFDALAATLRDRGMGLLLDVVPNHMCIATSENVWWNDVLENGRSSPYATFFDIDWQPPRAELHEKVLLPVLGAQYGRVLENQEISIGYEGGAFFARYGGSRYPLGPRTILPLLEPIVADLRHTHPEDHPDVLEIESIVTATKHLPTRSDLDPDLVRERMREKEIVKRRIDALVSASAAARDALERSLAVMNGERGNPRSFDRLEALLADQAYRLCYWGVAAEEINYRRFFDINDLAAIRVEEPKVMEAVHRKAFELLRAGKITGLRIDHVDGLLDPSRYLQNIHRAHGATDEQPLGTYVVVEKILTGNEVLPADWPVHGTTGYDFMNVLNGLFVEPAGARAIERFYQRLRNDTGTFEDLLYQAKKLILSTALSAELFVLARRLDRVSEQHRWSRDFTQSSLHYALGEVVACFPVYRTYVQSDTTEVSAGDRQHVLRAIRDAKRRNRSLSESIFDFIGDLLLLRDPEGISEADRQERRDLILRLQQLTGPVMAKGLEDTVFYRYLPLASLNEVGGRPTAESMDVDRFHGFCARRLAHWPHGLSATATHDTKRGEDMRARLDVLSEIPREWQNTVRQWQRLSRRWKPIVDEARVPAPNEEYLLYQTLVGAWPIEGEREDLSEPAREALLARVSAYMTKALREAKVHTSWVNVNVAYERAIEQFSRRLLNPATGGAFLAEIRRFTRRVATAGMWNGLSQVIIKATAPGVPDFYQGTELWDLSLVDPDNRRPVDFVRRRALLQAVAGLDEGRLSGFLAECRAQPETGALKLFITTRALRHRRERRARFDRGGYLPLVAEGPRARHVVAFARTGDDGPSITVAGRFFVSLPQGAAGPVGPATWEGTRLLLPTSLPPGDYREVISGLRLKVERESAGHRLLELEAVFAHLPVAILEAA